MLPIVTGHSSAGICNTVVVGDMAKVGDTHCTMLLSSALEPAIMKESKLVCSFTI